MSNAFPHERRTPMTPNTVKNNNNNFNLLRFVFASLVIISHAHEIKDGDRSNEILTTIFGSISFGELAVDCFFVISGYLITKSWLENPRFSAFLSSRILRIFPAFIVASLLCALILGPLYGNASYWHDFDPVDYLKSLVTLKRPAIPPVFEDTFYPTMNNSMWTISYEFKCYLLVLGFGMAGMLRRRYFLLTLAFLCACLQIFNRISSIPLPHEELSRFIMAFSVGGSFYVFRHRIPWNSTLATLAFLLCLSLLFFQPVAELGVCVFLGYSIIFYAHHGKHLLGFNRVPDMSYGIYLYAFPINKILYWHDPSLNAYTAMAQVFLLSIVCGALSWYLVEKPSLAFKKLFRGKRIQATDHQTIAS